MTMKRTKIVATMGPASSKPEVLRQMILAGLNLVRLNFSHGNATEKQELVKVVHGLSAELGIVVGVIADLQGPKIRVSKFVDGKVTLQDGAKFILDADYPKDAGNQEIVGIDYKELPKDVYAGDVLLLADGRLVFTVDEVVGNKVFCTVKVGGVLSNNKGINRQGGGLSAKALTDKDREDLKSAVAMNVDYMAISFPRNAADIEEAKQLIAEAGGRSGVIAKIERVEAIEPENLEGIIKAADGIMVARGDLAVEIGHAEVPAAQKFMIARARSLHKPVITATEMLETMVDSVVPTRAEVSDVANAVLDGTDAVMLSAETATGAYPVVVIQTMDTICRAAEKMPIALTPSYGIESQFVDIDEAVSMAAMYAANHLNVKAIISFTETGDTPLWLSRIRSSVPIYGLSRNAMSLRKMALYNNVYAINFDTTKYGSNAEVKHAAIVELRARSCINSGDLVVVTFGDHIGISGSTNSMTILRVE